MSDLLKNNTLVNEQTSNYLISGFVRQLVLDDCRYDDRGLIFCILKSFVHQTISHNQYMVFFINQDVEQKSMTHLRAFSVYDHKYGDIPHPSRPPSMYKSHNNIKIFETVPRCRYLLTRSSPYLSKLFAHQSKHQGDILYSKNMLSDCHFLFRFGGGRYHGKYHYPNIMYCIERDACAEMPAFTQHKRNVSIIYAPDHGLYTIGGYCGERALQLRGVDKLVQVVDNMGDEDEVEWRWKPTLNMKHGRIWHTSAFYQGSKIAVTGGFHSKTCESLDIVSNEVMSMHDMPFESHRHGICALDELQSIIVAGGAGAGKAKSVMQYNTHKDCWLQLKDTKYDHKWYPCISKLETQSPFVIAIAGGDGYRKLGYIEGYDLRVNGGSSIDIEVNIQAACNYSVQDLEASKKFMRLFYL